MTQTDTFRRIPAPALALTAVTCALLLSGCSLLGDAPAQDADGRAEAGLVSEAKATADRLLTAAREGLGFPAAAPSPAAPTPPTSAPARLAARAPRPQPAPAPPAVERAAAGDVLAALQPVPPLVAAASLVAAPAAIVPAARVSPPPSPASLYSRTDEGVQPPAWRSAPVSTPQLTGSAGHVAPLELIVGADGSVERARLLQGSRQLTDMMILSSAKMWQFEPARLDGEPVRYRLIVRLNAGESLE